jgi:alpha-N-arabinofuranosidase
MLVNAMAPIRAEQGGIVWRQTIFYPFAMTSRWARGTALEVKVSCESYDTEEHGAVPLVDATATYDPETGQYAVFAVNRSMERSLEVSADIQHPGSTSLIEALMLTDPDPYAKNSPADPERVVLQKNESARVSDGRLLFTLPPVSWNMVRLGADNVDSPPRVS